MHMELIQDFIYYDINNPCNFAYQDHLQLRTYDFEIIHIFHLSFWILFCIFHFIAKYLLLSYILIR